jgi:selenocysteine lyase/cysteine desulfurase
MNYKSAFSEFGNVTYLDVAAQGPLPRVSAQAMRKAIEWKEQPQKMTAEVYFGLPDRVRALLAKLVGGKPEEVAITTGATSGLAAIACGIDWKPEDEVLIAEREFPAHFTVFSPLAERGWLRVRTVRPRGRFLDTEDFLAEIGPHTRLVTTSLVRFHDATRIDAKRLAEAVHAAGAWLAFDASQCAGAMPLDVREIGADFVVCAGYKWLLGPYGTGFFWTREEHIAEMRPAPFYWSALPGARVFNSLDLSPYRPEPVARRWDAPETASLNLVALEASLEFLLGVGVETVWRQNGERIRQILDRMPRDRTVLASPAQEDRRGPYVCLAARSPGKTRELHEALRAAEIAVSLRENAIRIAPHLFTTPGDIDRLVTALTT